MIQSKPCGVVLEDLINPNPNYSTIGNTVSCRNRTWPILVLICIPGMLAWGSRKWLRCCLGNTMWGRFVIQCCWKRMFMTTWGCQWSYAILNIPLTSILHTVQSVQSGLLSNVVKKDVQISITIMHCNFKYSTCSICSHNQRCPSTHPGLASSLQGRRGLPARPVKISPTPELPRFPQPTNKRGWPKSFPTDAAWIIASFWGR
jgi:hypothetical protein